MIQTFIDERQKGKNKHRATHAVGCLFHKWGRGLCDGEDDVSPE